VDVAAEVKSWRGVKGSRQDVRRTEFADRYGFTGPPRKLSGPSESVDIRTVQRERLLPRVKMHFITVLLASSGPLE
jgi:hypothetical protein